MNPCGPVLGKAERGKDSKRIEKRGGIQGKRESPVGGRVNDQAS